MTLVARPSDGAGPGPGVLGAALLRISDARGDPRGVGFLVTGDLALTCAHVVSAALGLPAGAPLPEDPEVTVDLPLTGAPDAPRARARVVHWEPARDSGAGDIAVLELVTALPGARPTRLVEASDVWGHPARAFGFPAGRRGGAWHSAVLRDRQAGGWVQADLAVDGRYRVSGGFSGGPVWDDRLGGVVGMITVAEAGDPPASYLIPADTLLAVRPGLRELTLPPSPFRGLSAFREADAGNFHGRAAESEELAARVVRQQRTCLVGPSGCGKSSLALAGTVPLLRAEGFAVAVLRPASGSGPAAALAAALLPLLEPESGDLERIERLPRFTTMLTEGSLPDLVAQVLRRQDRERLLVVVDQLEEAFGAGPGAVTELADLLFTEHLTDPLHVLTTLRADFLETALAHPALGPLTGRGLHALGPLRAEGLREIVTAPVADIPGVDYESGLVDVLLTDTGDAPGALPLLGFTLDQLWRRQAGGLLTHHAYGELGGVTGAVGRHAERVWAAEVPAADEPAARRLLTALVRVPPGSGAATRRTAARTELDPGQWEIAQRLAETRLLVTGRSPEGVETVELAHEALFGGWRLLAELVAEDQAFLGWRELLRHDVDRWQRADRAPDLLPNATALSTAEPWLRERAADLSDTERDYLEQGRARRRATTRKRRALRSGLALGTVLVLVFGALFGYYRSVSGERAAESASRAFAQYSADQADGDPVLSAQLALAAYGSSHTREARDALLRAYLAQVSTDRLLSGPADAPIGSNDILRGSGDAIDTSLDGDVVLAGSYGGRATLFTHATAGEIRSQHITERPQIAEPLVSADGRRAGFLALDGRLIWYDVHRDGADEHLLSAAHRLPAVPGAGDQPYDGYVAALSADGRYAAALGKKHLLWWDLDAPAGAKRSGRVPAPGGVSHDIRFAPDGRTVLVKSYEDKKDSYEVKSVDRLTGTSRTLADGKGADEALISGDGTAVAFCAEYGEYGERVTMWRQPLTGDQSKRDTRPYAEKDVMCSAMRSVDATGRRVLVREDGWYNLVDLERRAITLSAGGPGDGGSEQYPRLGVIDGEPAQIIVGSNRVVYARLSERNRTIPTSLKALNRDGSKTIMILRDGSRIGIVPVGASRPTVRAYRPKPYWKPKDDDMVVFDRGERHLAERVGENRVMIRDFDTLKAVHEITTAQPPASYNSHLTYFFERSGGLITVSGTVIQRWDTATGRQLARYDAKALHPQWSDGIPEMMVAPYPEPGRVALTVWGQRHTRIVDLGSGRTTDRIDTGTDTNKLAFTEDARYFALLRRGNAVELWQREPLRELSGTVGLSVGTGTGVYALSFPDNTSFVLAAHGLIRTYRFGERAEEESVQDPGLNDQSTPYEFDSVSGDGRTVLVSHGNGHSTPVRLDPEVWRTALCAVIGHREPTEEQREGLPADLPDGPLCPGPPTEKPNPARPDLM